MSMILVYINYTCVQTRPGQYTGFVSKLRYLGDTVIGTACFFQYCHTVCTLWPPCEHVLFRS